MNYTIVTFLWFNILLMCGNPSPAFSTILSKFPTMMSFDLAREKATFSLFGLYRKSAISDM